MSTNRLIASAPFYVPVLIAVALALVTWYRPASPRMLDGDVQAPRVGDDRTQGGRTVGKP